MRAEEPRKYLYSALCILYYVQNDTVTLTLKLLWWARTRRPLGEIMSGKCNGAPSSGR